MFTEAGLRSLGEDVGSRWTIGNRKLDAKSVANANSGHGFGFRSAPPLSRARNGLGSNAAKVFGADELSDSATSTEVSYETEAFGVQNNISSHNECERRNVEAGTSGRTQNGTSTSTSSLPRFPTFHASEQGPWSAMIAYEACVRLCLHSWSMDSVSEASYFLNNECKIIRNAFSLQRFFLHSEEELLGKGPSELVTETSAPKSKKNIDFRLFMFDNCQERLVKYGEVVHV